eukprot:1154154-Pelagomonas_calceolata.AAC.1
MQRAARQLVRRAWSGLRCEPHCGQEVPGPQGAFFGAQQASQSKFHVPVVHAKALGCCPMHPIPYNRYYAGGFYVNNVQVPGSVIAQADMYLLWKPRKIEEVTPESLVFIDLIAPAPDLLVLGCGLTPKPLPKEVTAFLAERKMKVEVLNSAQIRQAGVHAKLVKPVLVSNLTAGVNTCWLRIASEAELATRLRASDISYYKEAGSCQRRAGEACLGGNFQGWASEPIPSGVPPPQEALAALPGGFARGGCESQGGP